MPWRDTMQVCLTGHVINASVKARPELNKDFCDTCGAKTIMQCPECNHPIPGKMQDTGVLFLGDKWTPPAFCQKCGAKFPWETSAGETQSRTDHADSIELLQNMFSRLHTVVRHLRTRHANRNTLDVSDEYDVQDLLRCLLCLHFDDIRPEEYTPSYAGGASRMDFLLKNEEIVIETKMTRKGLADKEIGDQLLVDIERYKEHRYCKTLVCLIYDPEGRVVNPKGLIGDLERQSRDGLDVVVFVNPV